MHIANVEHYNYNLSNFASTRRKMGGETNHLFYIETFGPHEKTPRCDRYLLNWEGECKSQFPLFVRFSMKTFTFRGNKLCQGFSYKIKQLLNNNDLEICKQETR